MSPFVVSVRAKERKVETADRRLCNPNFPIRDRRTTDGPPTEHRRNTDGTPTEHRRNTDGPLVLFIFIFPSCLLIIVITFPSRKQRNKKNKTFFISLRWWGVTNRFLPRVWFAHSPGTLLDEREWRESLTRGKRMNKLAQHFYDKNALLLSDDFAL